MVNNLTTEIIEKDFGWSKQADGSYTKTPYPFTIRYNSDTKEFRVNDLFFPEFVQYKPKEKLETIEDYDNLVIPILKVTKNASGDDIFNYKLNCLISSYNEAVKSELDQIEKLEATIKQNHIRTFIKYSFGNGDPIFKINNLKEFLNLQKADGSLQYFKGRYEENKEIFNKIEFIIIKTKEHLKTIYSSAVPNSITNN